MTFNKNDVIEFEGVERICVCCDDEVAIFGILFCQKDNKQTLYEGMIALPNQKEFENTIEHDRK